MKMFCTLLILFVFISGCTALTNRQTEQPNILFVIVDDASWLHFGGYDNRELRTPAMDRLASEGVVFENAFVSTSSCTPSRASILTGRNGFELEEGATLWGYLPARYTTYTDILSDNGYRVGYTGKGWAPGFLVDREQNPAGRVYNQKTYTPYRDDFERAPVSEINYAANFESFLTTTDPDKPFCFWMGTFEPHRGYTPGLAMTRGLSCDSVSIPHFMPESEEVRQDICEYYAEIEHVDDHINELMNVLDQFGQLDNTLILVTSDNGMPFPRAKATLYDYGTHMPLIAWWSDKIMGGRRITDLVSFTDIAPTILDVAGIDVPGEMAGSSFRDQIMSEKSGWIDQTRNTVYMYRERHAFSYAGGITFPSRAIRTDELLLIWNLFPNRYPSDVDGGPTKSFMETNRKQFTKHHELSFGLRAEYELYDIQKDSFQMNSLVSNPMYGDQLGDLQDRLQTYLVDRGDLRVSDPDEAFRYNPYFGILYETQTLKWTPGELGQDLTFEQRRDALLQAFDKIGEQEFAEEMIKRQNGAL